MIAVFTKYRSLFLFLSILFVLLSSPLIGEEGRKGASLVLGMLWATFIGIGGYLVSRSVKWMRAYGAALAIVLISANCELIWGRYPWVSLIQNLGVMSIQGCAFYVVLKYSLSKDEEDATDRTISGICGYFLLSLVWWRLFVIMQDFDPAAFAFIASEETVSERDLIYFSLVNLTTLGYGEMVPVNSFARILSALECAFGALYLAVMIATLVSELRIKNSEVFR